MGNGSHVSFLLSAFLARLFPAQRRISMNCLMFKKNSGVGQMNQNIYKILQKANYPTLSDPLNDQAAAAHGNLCLSVVRILLYKFQ